MNKIERALSLYEQWLAVGDAATLDALCKAHPDVAEHLRALAADDASIHDEIAAEESQSLGKTLGDYRLVAEPGRGGMGVVYLARQVSLDREVAVKVLPHHLTLQAATVARFRREANLAARLVHPGIVAIHAVGKDGDVHYFAMERVHGHRLARIDPRTGARRTVRQCVEIAAAVADALVHAHAQGVLHRDVKPSNILVRDDGQPVLTDFGLAREIGALRITKSGAYAGTPVYSAPEQLAGSKDVDGRADVWSLGATLYELLTDKLPFPGDSDHEVMHRIRFEEPADPLRLVPELAPDLTAIVLKALEKDRNRRYATAADFRDDLRAFLEHRPVSARRATRAQRAGRWLQRHPAWRAALAVAGLGLLAMPWLLSAATAAERDRAVAAEQSARRQAYAANVLAAQNALANGDSGQAAQRLAACPEPLRGFEWQLVARSLDLSVWSAQGSNKAATAVAIGGDARWVAVGDQGGEIAVFATGEATPRWRRRLSADPVAQLAIDPGCTYVVGATAAGAVRSFELASGQCLGELGPLDGDGAAAITPAANAVVRRLDASRYAVVAAPLLGGEQVRELDRAANRPYARFSSDGASMVGLAIDGRLSHWDLRTGRRTNSTSPAIGFSMTQAVSNACGDVLTLDSETSSLSFWSAAAADAAENDVGRRTGLCVALSMDGKQGGVGCQTGEVLVYSTGSTLRLDRILNGHRAAVRSLAAGQDGWLASGAADGEIKLWNILLDAGAGEIHGTTDPRGIGGHPLDLDGDALYVGGQSGLVRRTNRLTGQIDWEAQLPHWVNGLAVVGDGSAVACSYHQCVQFLGVADGRPLGEPTLVKELSYARRLVAAPDRRRLAILDQDGAVGVFDVATRQLLAHRKVVTLVPFRLNGGLAWTADGARIAVGDDAGYVRVLDAQTLANVADHAVDASVATLAIAGDELFVATWNRTAQTGSLSRRSLATGAVQASHALTSVVAAVAPLPGRLALARQDARLALHARDDLSPMLELPQPATHLWNVMASPDGAWLAMQCFGGQPRTLVANAPAATLDEVRARVVKLLAREAAALALGPSQWQPLARRTLERRTDLSPAVRDAAVACLPPAGTYFLILQAERALAGDAHAASLDLLLECFEEVEQMGLPAVNDVRSLRALVELRLGRPAAAEATLGRIVAYSADYPQGAAYAAFVRAQLALARGDAAAAAAATDQVRKIAAGLPKQFLVHDLLRELEGR